MPSFKNGAGWYKGTENSPKGRGFCSKYYTIGTKKRGRDKQMWEVRAVKLSTGKRCKRWFKVLPGKCKLKKTKQCKAMKKKTTKPKKIRGGANSREAEAAQMICDVLRYYIPVYAFTSNQYTKDSFRKLLEQKIKIHVLDRQYLDLFQKYDKRENMYKSKLHQFETLLRGLRPEDAVGIREVFLHKQQKLESCLRYKSVIMMVLDPEAYYPVLKDIGCEMANVIEVYNKKTIPESELDMYPASQVSEYKNRYSTIRHPHADDKKYEVNPR